MNARAILSSTGAAAWPLRSGGWLVDFGDPVPRWVPDRDAAETALATTSDSPAGQPTTPVAGHPRNARPGPTPAEVPL